MPLPKPQGNENRAEFINRCVSDDNIQLIPPQTISIESGLEIMSEDEYLEITPKSVRLRKKNLTEIDRSRSKRKTVKVG